MRSRFEWAERRREAHMDRDDAPMGTEVEWLASPTGKAHAFREGRRWSVCRVLGRDSTVSRWKPPPAIDDACRTCHRRVVPAREPMTFDEGVQYLGAVLDVMAEG
ncbi:MAG: hypothetical protein LC798_13545 [Chloroflexi bacterium]|nr:hypothetical protein [Chloroflexota bacterium]